MAIGRAGRDWVRSIVGRAKTGVGPKLARFFWAKILIAQSALKIGLIGPNSIFKAKKNSDGSGRAGSYCAEPYWVGPNLALFFFFANNLMAQPGHNSG